MAAPQVTPITENWHAEGFVVSEANGRRSRDQGTLASGQKVVAGTVLASIPGTTATAAALRTNTGNGTFGTINVLEPAGPGVYALTMETATTFEVTDPKGEEVGHGSTGVAFAVGGLSFTLTAGGTAFVQGDAFTLTVTGQYSVYDPTLNDGSAIATAISLNDTDATSAAKHIAVFARSGEVNQSELVWGTNATTAGQKAAALASLASRGIIAR